MLAQRNSELKIVIKKHSDGKYFIKKQNPIESFEKKSRRKKIDKIIIRKCNGKFYNLRNTTIMLAKIKYIENKIRTKFISFKFIKKYWNKQNKRIKFNRSEFMKKYWGEQGICVVCQQTIRSIKKRNKRCTNIKFNCNHNFHTICIYDWLETVKNRGMQEILKCPICNRILTDQETKLVKRYTGIIFAQKLFIK